MMKLGIYLLVNCVILLYYHFVKYVILLNYHLVKYVIFARVVVVKCVICQMCLCECYYSAYRDVNTRVSSYKFEFFLAGTTAIAAAVAAAAAVIIMVSRAGCFTGGSPCM